MHRVEDLLVPGAAAEIPRERLADLVVRGVGNAPEEIVGRDHEARGAEAALHGAGLDESRLHPVRRPVLRQALDGHDLVAVRLRGEHQARADERPVQEHRARAALALLARVLRPGQAEPVTQEW